MTLTRRFSANSVPPFAAGAVAVISLGAIVGWIFHIEPLMTVLPGLVRMKPNTAAAFLSASLALYLSYKRKFRPLQSFCAWFTALAGAITLTEVIWGVDAHIDQMLFRDPVAPMFPGRMAQISAAAFLLCGVMLYPFRFRGNARLTDLLALIVAFGSTLAVVGYLYGVPILYGSTLYSAMAIHTGVAFLFLSLGVLCIRKRHGFGRIFQAPNQGGLVARRLVPPAIVVPIVVGAVFNRFNFGQLRLGIVFIVMCNILFIVACIWGLARALDRSEIHRRMAQHASEFDSLTCIHNRGYFDQRLAEEVQRCLRYSTESCLILLDIDYFKSINDRFGHQGGDEVLKMVAQACESSLRAADIICRIGGEEFAIIAPETGGKDAMVLAAKLRILVAALTFEDVPVQVTISLGVAEIGRAAAADEEPVASADQALYASKKRGRNRETLYGCIEELHAIKRSA